MISLLATERVKKVLCLGAHSDDIEIGAGGTVLRLIRDNPGISVSWVVFSSNPVREAEARASADLFLNGAAEKQVTVHAFRDGFFPSHLDAIKTTFEQIKREFSPDLILTHFRDDLHQDHRVVNQLTWNTFRSHAILEYEIPKWDGDLGRPNVYVSIDAEIAKQKIQHLISAFASQRDKHWFTDETFRAILRLHGVESNNHYAEGFHGRKLLL